MKVGVKQTEIKVNIRFPEVFETKPRVKIIKPINAKVISIGTEEFSLAAIVKSVETKYIEVEYQVNFKPVKLTIPVQFCPACEEVIHVWSQVIPLVLDPRSGKTVPGPPLGFCPKCFNVFIANRVVEMLEQAKDSRIIVPGR